MTRMHNPPHPGEVLREYLGDITVTEAAVKLGAQKGEAPALVVLCTDGHNDCQVRSPLPRDLSRERRQVVWAAYV